MQMNSLQDLFLHHMKDMYYAEKKILKSLPKMAEKAGEEQLRKAFQEHEKQTQGQIKRLEQVFQELGEKAGGDTCEAIDGIIEEAEELMQDAKDENTCDAGLISSAQAVEHYEIARYGTMATWAKQLGMKEAEKLLHQNLEEEKNTDQKLTRLAEQRINRQAA
jgi:ferritin-like metal-binding protein YciE